MSKGKQWAEDTAEKAVNKILSQELKGVLEKLLDNTTVKMYNINKGEYAYDFI